MDSVRVRQSSETKAELPTPVAPNFLLEGSESEAEEPTPASETEAQQPTPASETKAEEPSPASSIDENLMNRNRLMLLRRQFTSNLLALIWEEDFEYGIDTKADKLVRNQMSLNASVTKEWLTSLFVENFANVPTALGLLRIIARMEYSEVYPAGQTMAVAALSHGNAQIQECGVRAFESWGTLKSLEILENLTVSTQWLEEYIHDVVSDLRKEHRVSTR